MFGEEIILIQYRHVRTDRQTDGHVAVANDIRKKTGLRKLEDIIKERRLRYGWGMSYDRM